MFDRRDYRIYQGVNKDGLYPQICDWWARQGFYVAQIYPFHIQGSSYYSKIGLRREFNLRMDDRDGSTHFDLNLRASITDEGLVGGVAAAVLLWPVAVVGGALSYNEYEKDARNLMVAFWTFLDQISGTRGSMAPNIPQPPQPGSQNQTPHVSCKGCGALLPMEWKACPYCGSKMK
jgi:hypothetical protein